MSSIQKALTAIATDPDNPELYERAVHIYFSEHQDLWFTEAPQKLVLECIKRFPEMNCAVPEFTSQVGMPPARDLALAIWKGHVSHEDVSDLVLKNAGIFCINIDTVFSAECLEKFYLKNQNDLPAIQYYAKSLTWLARYAEALVIFKTHINSNAEVDPFMLSEACVCASKCSDLASLAVWSEMLKQYLRDDPYFMDPVKAYLDLEKVKVVGVNS